ETFDLQVGELRRWDAATGQPLGPAVEFAPWLAPVQWAWSPGRGNWERLLTGSLNGVAQQWDVATGQPVGPGMGHAFPVVGLEYSPDGRMLATGCSDGTVRLWDAATSLPLGPSRRVPALLGLTF